MKKSLKRNALLLSRAKKSLVGGVNSPVRSFNVVGGTPVFIKRGHGPHLFDEDGRKYIDFCLSWGVSLLGHAHPSIRNTLRKAMEAGTSFGINNCAEFKLAEKIRKGIPAMERIRFVNSGTEAVMGAIRLARAWTGREMIVKFDGCYHGHADYLLAKAGSGAFGLPDSAGVPKSFTEHTLILPYNDLCAVKEVFKKQSGKIAAVIVEPVAANMGVVAPNDGFLQGLRDLCECYGAVLIFDEVITGFRFCYGGAQNYFNIKPDLTVLGKIIGGGLPIGAFGGNKSIMKLLAPEGPVYQAGTFSGNPLSMNAGIAALDLLSRRKFYELLWNESERFYVTLRDLSKQGSFRLNAFGPMFSISFSDARIFNAATARLQDVRKFRKFFHILLKQGVYLSPSPFEAIFISSTHTRNDLDKAAHCFEVALKAVAGNKDLSSRRKDVASCCCEKEV